MKTEKPSFKLCRWNNGLCNYQVGLKTNFIEQKYYRTCVWHLNKVWSTNFVDDNVTLAVE